MRKQRMRTRSVPALKFPEFYDRLNKVIEEIEDAGFTVVNVSHSTVMNAAWVELYSAVVLYK